MQTTRVATRPSGLVVDLVTTTTGTKDAPVHLTLLTVGPEGGPSSLHAEVARTPGLTARRVKAASEALAHHDALDALPDFLDEHPAVSARVLGRAA